MLGFGVFVLAGAAAASPVYLACPLQREAGPLVIDVVVNEPVQEVTISVPGGRTVTRKALFTPSEVRMTDDQTTWIFNRVDLSFQHILSFMPASDPGDTGKCSLKPAPTERAF